MSSVVRECRWCHRRQVVRLDTDGRGGVVEEALPCGCDEKRERRLCIDCGGPHGGWKQRLRCEPCQAVASRGHSRRWRANHPEQARSIQKSTNRKRRTAAGRARRREFEREYRSRPEVRERRKRMRRRRAVLNPTRKAEAARRYKEHHPERVKAQQDAANARRAEAKREYQHRYATKYVGEGKAPLCRRCENEVPWDGRGRPRLDCFECRPLDSQERKSVRARRLAATQASAVRGQEERRTA